MMRSNGVPKEMELKFKLGDVVLCRYSSYPYWPATVDQTHQKRYKGKYYAMLRTRGGDLVLCFWCTFSNEDTGGWVRADRMVLFHPAILNKIRVAKDSEWHAEQKEAIESAVKSFHQVYKGDHPKVPQLPADLDAGHTGKWDVTDDDDIISDDEAHPELLDEDPMDLGEESEDGAPPSRRQSGRATKAGKTLARPKAQKEPRKALKRKSLPAEEARPKKRTKASTKLEKDLLDSVDNDPEEPRRKVRDRDVEEEVIDRSSGKRRRHSYAHPSETSNKKMRKLEEELSSAKETIASLKKSLRRKEKALSQLTGQGSGVACVIPPLPPPVEESLPPRDRYRSVPVNSKRFNTMMDTLDKNYDSFKKAAEAADQARTELEEAMESIKKLYNEASEKVSAAEDKAAKKEGDMVRDLREILEADVQVQNLRERKAGHVIRAMLKKCKDLPAIHDFCDAIYKSWKIQVVDYMKENEGKLKQESPSGAKSSPGEKSDRKKSESPTANAKTAPKDKVKDEDDKASAKDKSDKSGKEDKEEDVEMKGVTSKGEDTKEEEPKKPKEEAELKVEDKVEEEEEKTPTGKSIPTAKNKTSESGKAEETCKESSEKADENKSDDTKREDKPTEKEVPDSTAPKKKPDSSSKVEDRDRPPAKGENK